MDNRQVAALTVLPNFFVRAYEKAKRRAIRHSRNPRPASDPFLSGDTFRARADHVFEETSDPFNPASVKHGDVVFVKTDRVETFFQQHHPRIPHRYILLTHNSDLDLSANAASAADTKIIEWYAQNLTVQHPHIKPLPIGLENLHYYHNGIIGDFVRLAKHNPSKASRVLASFNPATNPPVREHAREVLQAYPLADWRWGLNSYAYRRLLQTYQFVASPRGNGLDCHRTWEALYLGVIPIVLTSPLDALYRDYPVWILKDWRELYGYDAAGLHKKYAEIMEQRHDPALLRADHVWQQVIKK